MSSIILLFCLCLWIGWLFFMANLKRDIPIRDYHHMPIPWNDGYFLYNSQTKKYEWVEGIKWDNRILYDSNEIVSIDWSGRDIYRINKRTGKTEKLLSGTRLNGKWGEE